MSCRGVELAQPLESGLFRFTAGHRPTEFQLDQSPEAPAFQHTQHAGEIDVTRARFHAPRRVGKLDDLDGVPGRLEVAGQIAATRPDVLWIGVGNPEQLLLAAVFGILSAVVFAIPPLARAAPSGNLISGLCATWVQSSHGIPRRL